MTAEIWQLRLFPLSSEGQPPSLLVQPAQVPARRVNVVELSRMQYDLVKVALIKEI